MAAKILTISDFEKGVCKIPLNIYSTAEFQNFLDVNEEKILNDILSSPLTEKLLDDITDGEPAADRFKNLFTLGLKDILIVVMFYRYLTQKGNITLAQAGFINNKADAAEVLTPFAATQNIIRIYNQELFIPDDKICNLQSYIIDNTAIYPEFITYSSDYFVKTAKQFKIAYIL